MGLFPLLADPPVFLVALALALLGLVLHNLFQAYLADRYGETAPRRYGFLSADLRVHLEPLGLVFLVLLGFGWPRPVPTHLPGRKGAFVALMGPLGFFLAAFFYGLLARFLPYPFGEGLGVAQRLMLLHAAIYLFPVPPLDGAKALYAVGGHEARRFLDQLSAYGPIGFLLIFLVLSYTGVTGAVVQGLASLLGLLYRAMGL
ncbi:MAG: site-2 protease family protein [Thermus sp.]|uniref:site-2 protease family protein n=1 Tax=Thermus sp. TaxID=275 RepID=UPI0025FCA04B|nr:site-2 protease family protein [Thermus sp.]MCS6868756.1 site-2 protease family protein [Thermus sp.]MCS7217676.1 site-2 protease family protein [Thermus sp.]MCX7850484.1 site-2 protease family protein [Thermus sp.]MDW8017110.1 site-2 protease family protein [Thermus sp.]MDW8358385.1 site-2 protease family protein [Thermus sp.]